MTRVLSTLTTGVNLAGLAVAVCLAFYIVTRAPRNRTAWLAGLTLSLLACLFVYNAWGPVKPWGDTVRWLRPLTLLVIPAWLHLALVLPDRGATTRFGFYLPPLWRGRGHMGAVAGRAAVPLAYGLTLALLAASLMPSGRAPAQAMPPLTLITGGAADPYLGLALALMVVAGAGAGGHLAAGLRAAGNPAERRLSRLALIATGLAGTGSLYLGLGTWLDVALPRLPADGVVAAATSLLGYAVAEYHAWVEGRALRQDLLYGAAVIGSLALACVAIAELLYRSGHVFSTLTMMVILIVAIGSLMVYDGARSTWDRLFYRKQFQHLRADLRALAREAGTGQPLGERLQAILHGLCRSLGVDRGLIALREGDEFVGVAAEGGDLPGGRLAAAELEAADIVALPRAGAAPGDAAGMAVLVPIHGAEGQVGALLLGPKESGGPLGEQDRLLLDNAAEQLATLIEDSRLQEQNARMLSEMVADFRDRERDLQRQVQQMLSEGPTAGREAAAAADEQYVPLVEDALRRIYDYPYLGEHALARLEIVDRCLAGRRIEFITHLDRGQAVSQVLLQALEKLRPPGAEPKPQAIPPREWHPYVVLHDAYVLSEPNRDIMSRLYVGEGTFNRTRRHALRAVARALLEMEREAQQASPAQPSS